MFELPAPGFSEDDIKRLTLKLTHQWLEGWGAVERERLLTGDPSARPKGSFEVVGGRRGSPSDPGSLMEVWGDIELTVGKKRPYLRAALLHKYRDGAQEGGGFEYDFGCADFRAFFSPERWLELERTLGGCGKSARWMFERLVRDFEWELARERGLRTLAISRLQRGNW